MKHKLTTLTLTLFVTGVFAQNEMMHVPNGTSGIAATTSGNGVAIGPGFTNPEGRLHVFDKTDNGTALIIELETDQIVDQQGGFTLTSPDYFLQAKYRVMGSATAKTNFSVSAGGKVQSGFFSSSVDEQVAILKTKALYGSNNQKLRFELSNNEPRFLWKSPGKNFQFVNLSNTTIALQLGENGQVGVNTGDFFDNHNLYVDGSVYIKDDGEEDHSLYIEGSSIAEEMFVKIKADWGDFVFEKEYDLMPLDELEDYLKENKHLPNFPSAAEIKEDGLALGETERLLTIKVEELTLYILALKKEVDAMKAEIKD